MSPRCGVCGAEVSATARFCSACGAPLDLRGDAPTAPGLLLPTPAPRVGRLASSDTVAVGGYAPGAVLGARYRIIGLLGRGGMGEVYRADDLKLGQAVALKFLPDSFAEDPAKRDRFYAEVRIARQVSHPNVCRVYDIAEVDGRQALSMEYIDGEDLASLLKRIGHVPGTKVQEISQQLCAGLAAAHHQGVLHRDLKPANVMIDGRGFARITDFGLAVAIDHTRELAKISGTPLYMAPEQLAGQSASVQSDIYALGVVLYELSTGKRPFTGNSIAELRRQKEHSPPEAPSEIISDVDPVLERVILRCLDKDPRARPSSVLQVAAALPGGNPLAAAIAAGETPSPEMVAASVPTEGLRRRTAAGLLVALAACTAVSVWLGASAVLSRRVPLERPPDALAERARQIVESAGLAGPAQDTAFGISYNDPYLRYVHDRDGSPARWDRLSPAAVQFWYRQSVQPLRRLAFSIGLGPRVTPDEPPLASSGEVRVVLNGRGELIELTAVPSQLVPKDGNAVELDWAPLFRAANLDVRAWQPAAPSWTPPFASDRVASWQTATGGERDRPDRVEAAAYGGKPVSFVPVYGWTSPGRIPGAPPSLATRTANFVGIALTAVAMFGGLVLAQRNLRLGRGDRRGARRLVLFVTVFLSLAWLLDEHHVLDSHEWYLFTSFAGRVLVIGGLFWVLYVAFEPYVRRHWPSTIVSWSRLLAGGIRDPLVGRDVLVGCVAGALVTCLLMLSVLVPSWLDRPAEALINPTWRAWFGTRPAISLALQLVLNALLESFTALFLLVLVRQWLRREILAAVVTTALLATPDVLLSEDPVVAAVCFFLVNGLGVFLLMRVGLLAVIALRFTVDLLEAYPLVPDLSAWYSSLGIGALVVFAAIAIAAAYASIGVPARTRPLAFARPGT